MFSKIVEYENWLNENCIHTKLSQYKIKFKNLLFVFKQLKILNSRVNACTLHKQSLEDLT